jgi:DNA-binding beta-propeller fold protein YncE
VLSGLSSAVGAAPARRRWWRSPLPLAAVAALVLVAGGGGYYLAGHQTATAAKPPRKAPVVLPALAPPGCGSNTTSIAPTTNLTVDSTEIDGNPFAVQESADGKFTFATFGGGFAVLSNPAPGSTGGSLAPTLQNKYFVDNANKGLWLTPDGQYLLAAGGSGAVVINVNEAENGDANPVVGMLAAPQGDGAIGVITSPDGKYAFVTLQNTTTMAVFNLAEALANGFGPADFVGFVPTNVQPDGLAVSPDGKWLYVTSVQRNAEPSPSEGTLSVVSLHRAEVSPATSVVSVARAGCGPARVIVQAGTVWVTARDSNVLLAFSAALLRTHPGRALRAEVQLGANPIGMLFIDGGRRIAIADTNLHSQTKASGDIAIVDVDRALTRKPALLGIVPVNGQPRQLAVSGGTLLMANMVSGLVQAVAIADLP